MLKVLHIKKNSILIFFLNEKVLRTGFPKKYLHCFQIMGRYKSENLASHYYTP